MSKIPHAASLLIGLLFSAHAASAQSLAECARIVDANERVQCYDRLAATEASAAAPAPAAESVPEPQPAPDPAPQPTPEPQSAPEPVTAEQAEPPQGEAPAAADAEADFGVEARMESGNKSELREIEATLVSIEETASGKRVFRLDNDQVWFEQSRTRRLKLEPGDTVRIKAGSLGSYKLIGNAKISTKVERLR